MPEIVEALEPTAGVEETQPTAEAPAAPEPSAPSAPADEAATTEPAAAVSTRQRGPDGRFIKADGTQASEAEHAAIVAADPASPPSPVPPPAPVTQPFVVRGDGQRHTLPGTINEKGELTIPAEHVPGYKQLLAEGLAHRGSWRQKEQDYQRQIEEAGAVKGAEAEKWFGILSKLYVKLTDPDTLRTLAADPREVDYLKRELELEHQMAEIGAPKLREAPPQDPAVEQQQLRVAATDTLREYVEELLESPQARSVYTTPEDREKAIKRYERRLAAYFVEQDGQGLLLDTLIVKEDFDEELALRQAQIAQAKERQKAEEFNAKRNVPPVAPPPVVSPRGPGGNGTTGVRTFKTREEYQKAMGIG